MYSYDLNISKHTTLTYTAIIDISFKLLNVSCLNKLLRIKSLEYNILNSHV